jgi:transcriptional regulator GlxA family with amidase domain
MEERKVAGSRRLSFGFLLAPGFTLIAFAGFLEILRHAADSGDKSRQRLCSWTVMGPRRDPVAASAGVQIIPWEPFRDPRNFNYVVIVGGVLPKIRRYDSDLLHYLRRAGSSGVPLIGLCTGSFYLARAGLMRRRKCCVHWYHFQDFIDEFPDTIPITDEIFICDRDRITCPGGMSAADLALFLVERHLGKDRAVKCLRHQLLDWARPHNHPQAPFTHDYATIVDPRVRKAVYLMEQSLGGDLLGLENIAARVNTSIRHLERLFHTHCGQGPLAHFRQLRLRYGRWLLVNTDRSITAIAHECGFSDSSHFARWFKSAFGQSPAAARRGGQGASLGKEAKQDR